MPYTTSPNMQLPIPTVGSQPGPAYAQDVNQALQQVDYHNHSPGQGVPIGAQGLNITTDLSVNVSNVTNVRSMRFTSTTASSGTDVGSLYVKGVDLFYNDLNGNVIPVTRNGALASTSVFAGQISTTAIVSANSGIPASSGFIRMDNNIDFVSWRNAANSGDDKVYFDNLDYFRVIGAGAQASTFRVEDPTGSGRVGIQTVSASSSYSLMLPSSPPSATTGIMQMNTAGVVTVSNTVGSPLTIGNSGAVLSNNGQALAIASQANGVFLQIDNGVGPLIGKTNSISTNSLSISSSAGGSFRPLMVGYPSSAVNAGPMMVRGVVDMATGVISYGEGFVVNGHPGTGTQVIGFQSAFADIPVVIATPWVSGVYSITAQATTNSACTIVATSASVGKDITYNFIAIGMRG